MSLTQFYALSAPAWLGVLAIGFGLFELYRVRRIKAAVATNAAGGTQAPGSETAAARASETIASPSGLRAGPANPSTSSAQASEDAGKDISSAVPDWSRAPYTGAHDVYYVGPGLFVLRLLEKKRPAYHIDWTGAQYERKATGRWVRTAADDQDRLAVTQAELDKMVDEISKGMKTTQEGGG